MPSAHEVGSLFNFRPSLPPADNLAGTRAGAVIDRGESASGPMSGRFFAQTGAVSGAPTSFSYEAKVQHSADNGATDPWTDYAPDGNSAPFKITLTAANSYASKKIAGFALKRFVRLFETTAFVGGATPKVLGTGGFALGNGLSESN